MQNASPYLRNDDSKLKDLAEYFVEYKREPAPKKRAVAPRLVPSFLPSLPAKAVLMPH